MIKDCVKTHHRNEILNYIGTEYYKCLYLYIDLIKYGCISDITKTWIQENEGKITAVMLAYHSAMHVYSQDLNFDVNELSAFILERNPSIICARAEIIKILEPMMRSYGFVSEYGHIGKFVKCEPTSVDYEIRLANKDDINEIAQLLYEDDDIGTSYSLDDLIKQMEERLNDGFVRSYVVKDNDHVVAHLATGAEIRNLSTVCYGITHPEYRGRGLFKNLMSFLCTELGKEGKEIYSVYYMENARRQHHKVGFVDCCDFGKLFREVQ